MPLQIPTGTCSVTPENYPWEEARGELQCVFSHWCSSYMCSLGLPESLCKASLTRAWLAHQPTFYLSDSALLTVLHDQRGP